MYFTKLQVKETFATEISTGLKLSAALNAYIYMEKIKDIFKKNDAFLPSLMVRVNLACHDPNFDLAEGLIRCTLKK